MVTELSLWILDYLDSHLYEEINIDTLSSFIGYDKSYIMKRFKKDVGVSIKTYLNQKKIINSLKLLEDDSYLLNVALNSGFNSLEYYSEVFRRIIGVNPSGYRKYLLGVASNEECLIIENSLLLLSEFEDKLGKERLREEYILSYKKKCA